MTPALRIHEPGIWDEGCFPPRMYNPVEVTVFPDIEARDVIIEAPGNNGKPESVLISGKENIGNLIAALSAVYQRM